MGLKTNQIGILGEKIASQYLRRKGYSILAHHYTTRWGEIDIIAQDGEEIVFVEVKGRRTRQFGPPEEAVTDLKLSRFIRSVYFYLQRNDILDKKYRIDIISLFFYSPKKIPTIRHLKNILPPDLEFLGDKGLEI